LASTTPTPTPCLNLQRVASLIREAPPASVLVLVGAGASVSAGIPDFRTPGTGLYDNLQKYDLPFAEAVFDIDYFKQNPYPFYQLCKDMWPGTYQPTAVHRFIAALHAHGKLRRCFTQNIDSLEAAAGLPAEKVVAAHGNFDKAHVVRDYGGSEGLKLVDEDEEVDIEEVRQAVMEGEEGVRRVNQKYGGLVKPAITFFGESLPPRFARCVESDFGDESCRLLLIFGTSLQVQPFASLVTFVEAGTPRFLMNRERVGEELGLDFDTEGSTDGAFLGECDDGVRQLALLLGWDLD